jgi:hydrogenase maturation protease
VLVVGIGNPSRGDDAIGPLLVERLEARAPVGVELLTEFQLQVEHVFDLQDRREVIFADAAVRGAEPFEFAPVVPAPDTGYSSHALLPAALLHHYRQLVGEPPEAFVLAIRGYEFSLGAPISAAAAQNLDAALNYVLEFCTRPRAEKPRKT